MTTLVLVLSLAWVQPAVAAPPTGTVIAAQAIDLEGRECQAILVEHILDGHVPSFIGALHPVTWSAADADGVQHTVQIEVTPDYVSVGTDRDFLRAPLDLISALKVSRAWGMVLPTTKMVDMIYEGAKEKVEPRTMPPSDRMRSIGAYLAHRARLRAQGLARPSEALRAGHKKDLVMTPRLEMMPTRVAIYGWHTAPGAPIQPLSLWHGAGYTDYSHGLRLVSPVIRIDGEEYDVFDILADPILSALISDEGPWANARRVMAPDEEPVYPF